MGCRRPRGRADAHTTCAVSVLRLRLQLLKVFTAHASHQHIGREPEMLERLPCERRGVVLLQPALDRASLVRLPVGGEDRVEHELRGDRAQQLLLDMHLLARVGVPLPRILQPQQLDPALQLARAHLSVCGGERRARACARQPVPQPVGRGALEAPRHLEVAHLLRDAECSQLVKPLAQVGAGGEERLGALDEAVLRGDVQRQRAVERGLVDCRPRGEEEVDALVVALVARDEEGRAAVARREVGARLRLEQRAHTVVLPLEARAVERRAAHLVEGVGRGAVGEEQLDELGAARLAARRVERGGADVRRGGGGGARLEEKLRDGSLPHRGGEDERRRGEAEGVGDGVGVAPRTEE
mmetsp:Transcript_19953/g.49748  ORF Transcript_19953/g.49748 Transcript_19953/m.49748 type:complete len:355 (+) Transcript_19953:460-1524(+)